MCYGSSSQLSEPTDLTPAKRIIPPVINLEEAFDQNSITRMACIIKVKKEKIEKRRSPIHHGSSPVSFEEHDGCRRIRGSSGKRFVFQLGRLKRKEESVVGTNNKKRIFSNCLNGWSDTKVAVMLITESMECHIAELKSFLHGNPVKVIYQDIKASKILLDSMLRQLILLMRMPHIEERKMNDSESSDSSLFIGEFPPPRPLHKSIEWRSVTAISQTRRRRRKISLRYECGRRKRGDG
ncbi:hypothetical protein Bca101_083240 [Brassica carinata]